jgi:THO complex subunit 2
MENLNKLYLATVTERIASAKVSQLAMAAPLESTGPSTTPKPRAAAGADAPKTKLAEKQEKEALNQKLGLLNALLALGVLKPALTMLSRFPWLIDASPTIADLLLRILSVSIYTLHDTIDAALAGQKDKADFSQPRARFGAGGLTSPSPRKPQLVLVAPTPPCTHQHEFVYFFPDWADRIPVCRTFDDLVSVIGPLMAFVKVHASRNTMFFSKLIRLGRAHLYKVENDQEHPARTFWFNMLRSYLLPAHSLLRGHMICTVDMWNMVRLYEPTLRWQLWAEWKSKTMQSHPELRVRAVQADRESKGVLRRLSMQTVDTLEGTVAKLAHHNPCIFFSAAINQVMAYENIATVVIKPLRLMSNMGFDVLGYCIFEAIANPNKARVKEDGVNIADWLQSTPLSLVCDRPS